MSKLHGAPGLGGGQGKCIVCGKSFITEMAEGLPIPVVAIEGVEGDCVIHALCRPKLYRAQVGHWKQLPHGPLRKMFSEAVAALEEKG